MDFTRQGNMTVNSMFPTCFNPGNLLLSFQTNFYRIISWKLAIFHSVKATMLAGGMLSFHCANEAALCSNLRITKADHTSREKNSSFSSEAISILRNIKEEKLIDKCTEHMIEEYVDINVKGTYQYCMEGFVSREGKVISYSLVEEVFFKNMMLLGHIIPPIHFDGNFEPFESFMEWVSEKLSCLGFQNQAFDVEFWQLPDGSFRIIEINPRMAASWYDLYHQYSGNNIYQDVASFVHHGIELEKTPLSHLKHMWPISGRNHAHSFQAVLTTRTTGRVGDVFDLDFLHDRIANGLIGFIRLSKDDILYKAHSTAPGTIVSNVTLKGSWSEIVTEEKRLRKKLYNDKDQFCEAEYPDCFTAQ